MQIALFALIAFLMIRLQALFYRKQCFRGVESIVTFRDEAVTEGEASSLTEVIRNRKRLPLIALRVNFSVSRALVFLEKENSAATDFTYRNDIFSVMPYEQVTRTLPFTCTKRGYYRIEDFYLLGQDLFMTEKYIKNDSFDTHLYVYPAPADPERLSLPLKHTVGAIITNRSHLTDPFEFRGIREYQIYDPMKAINWKASAKGAGLMVNINGYTANDSATLILDLETDAVWQPDTLMEESIRILASFAEGLLRRGIPVRILSNGTDLLNGQIFHLEHSASLQHIRTVKEGLARLDIHHPTPGIVSVLEQEQKNRHTDTVYILVSHIQSPALIEAYEQLCSGREGCQWIAPLHYDMDCPALSVCRHAKVTRWEVPYGQR